MIFLFCSLLCFYWVMGTLDRTVRLAVADTGQSDAAHRAALEVATTDRDSDRGSDRDLYRDSDGDPFKDRDLDRDSDPFKTRMEALASGIAPGGARVAWANE